ncbi:hypothetical protein GCM10027521_25740 [Amycolatopsis cihanbeyliensis]
MTPVSDCALTRLTPLRGSVSANSVNPTPGSTTCATESIMNAAGAGDYRLRVDSADFVAEAMDVLLLGAREPRVI